MPFSKKIQVSLFLLLAILASQNAQSQLSKTVGLLNGDVKLADGSPVVGVPVTIFKGTDILTTTKTSPDGKISMVLQPNAIYRLRVNSSDYLYHEDTLDLGTLKSYKELPVHMVLTPLKDGQIFDMPLPVFAPASQEMLPQSKPTFDRIVDQMKHNSKLSATITVYPDGLPKNKKDNSQKILATARETSIRSYFVGKGMPESRFSVQSEISSIPPGKFQPNDPSFPPTPVAAPVTSKKKGKKSKTAPTTPGLVPQYVEVVAHLVG